MKSKKDSIEMNKKLIKITLLCLFAFSAILMVIELDTPGLTWDELLYIRCGEYIVNNTTLNFPDQGEIMPTVNVISCVDQPPLSMFLIGLSNSLSNLSLEVSSRLPSVISGIVNLLLVYALGRRLFGKRIGILAMLLSAFEINLLAASRLATREITATMFSTMALLGLYIYLKKYDKKYKDKFRANLLVALSVAFCLITKFSALPLALFAILVFSYKRDWKAIIILVVTISIILYISYFGRVDLILQTITRVNLLHSLGSYTYFQGDLHNPLPPQTFILISILKTEPAILLLFSIGFISIIQKRKIRKEEALLLSWIIFYLSIYSFVSLHRRVRLLLPMSQSILIICALSFDFLKKFSKKIALLVLIVSLSSMVLTAFLYHSDYLVYVNDLFRSIAVPEFLSDSELCWGNGLDDAADYVNEKDIKDVYFLHTGPTHIGVEYLENKTWAVLNCRENKSDLEERSYIIAYLLALQKNEDCKIFLQDCEAEVVINHNGIDLVWIYKLSDCK